MSRAERITIYLAFILCDWLLLFFVKARNYYGEQPILPQKVLNKNYAPPQVTAENVCVLEFAVEEIMQG